MSHEQTKLTLQVYRPGGQDAQDALFADALDQVRRDPELTRWFEAEQSLDEAIGEKFKGQSVPHHLESDILAVGAALRPTPWWQRKSWMAAAALVLVLAVAAFWLPTRSSKPNFATYRESMTDFLSTRFDRLDFKAQDLVQLKQFLAQRGAPSEFILPAGMNGLPSHGCRVLDWDGRTVSLVCFHLRGGKEIHLFVMQGTKFADPPRQDSVQFASSGRWTTASWRRGQTTYLLAGNGDRAFVEKYL